MTLEEIETFARSYIGLLKLKQEATKGKCEVSWDTVETAFIDGAKSAVLGGIDWKNK